MRTYLICYDILGAKPSVAEVEHRIHALQSGGMAKLLDRVWAIKSPMTGEQIYEHVNSLLGNGDRLLVSEAPVATFRDLLTETPLIRKLWP
jgi:hypothetical protein